MFNKLYLNVPYSEKEEAKKFGAKWDPLKKQWYYNGDPKNYINFGKWIFDIEKYAGASIICDVIYILEGKQVCWKCKKETPVIGLGVEKFINIFDTEEFDENDNPIYDVEIEGFQNEKRLFITWFDNENECPKFLLKYLKENYNVKTGFSSVVGPTFANHCIHCNALQGNFFIFHECDTPFSLTENSLKKNIEKIKSLKIKRIQLEENFISNLSYSFSGDEELYLKYGSIEKINLK